MSADPTPSPKGSSPSSGDTFAPIRVQQMLMDRGGKRHELDEGGCYIEMPNGRTVRFPPGFDRMSLEMVRDIAEMKAEMSNWDFDHWLNDQDKSAFITKPFSPSELKKRQGIYKTRNRRRDRG
jgi:hypothetical protein